MFSVSGHIPIEEVSIEYLALVPVDDAMFEGTDSCVP